MQLTKYTDYALRVLLYLGQRQDRRTTINDITEHYHISRNHLMKIIHHLSQAGYVQSSRGRLGGLSLGMDPAEINIGTVVGETEKNMALVECFGTHNTCTIEPECVLKYVLHRAHESFMEALAVFTLADILALQKQASDTGTVDLKPIIVN